MINIPLLCRFGLHLRVKSITLRGGEGPDEAAKILECTRCGTSGWKWCDGSTTWKKL